MADYTEHTARPAQMADPPRPPTMSGRLSTEDVSLGPGKSTNSPAGGTGGHGPSGSPPGQGK